jgi:hypothetical protein
MMFYNLTYIFMGNNDCCCLFLDEIFLLIKYVKYGVIIGSEALNNVTLPGFNKLHNAQRTSRVIISADKILI